MEAFRIRLLVLPWELQAPAARSSPLQELQAALAVADQLAVVVQRAVVAQPALVGAVQQVQQFPQAVADLAAAQAVFQFVSQLLPVQALLETQRAE